MFQKFIWLEWKAFFRSASFKANLFIKILMILGAIYFMGIFAILGAGSYFILSKEFGFRDPLLIINKYILYWFAAHLLIRYLLQKIPVMNIRPLMALPVKKATLVHFILGKTAISFFNILHAFFFIPFSIVLLVKGYDPLGVIAWHISMMAFVFASNFLNVLANKQDKFLIPTAIVLVALAASHYYNFFDVTVYTQPFFHGLYEDKLMVLLPIVALALLYYASFRYFITNMYFDGKLSVKVKDVTSKEYSWLNKYGILGTFLKNDIKLIVRNKRPKSVAIMGVFFIAYGLLFFTGAIEVYDSPPWKIFAGIFVSGGFLMNFGQLVPSWDSAYYKLMMSQNITYRDYLTSKWWLMVIATVITTILSAFYLVFGWEAYAAIVVGAVYNIGVNSHMVLWTGAYVKTPIDLGSAKNAFGNKQGFNAKVLLLAIPKLIVPLILFSVGYYLIAPVAGYIFVLIAGILGFALKAKVFSKIEKLYKTEKYSTIDAYSQIN